MSSLVQVLEDEGVDHESIRFLVEALSNAEPSDWDDILEPFVRPAPILDVLVTEIDALEYACSFLSERFKPPPPPFLSECLSVERLRDTYHYDTRCFDKPGELEKLQKGLQDAGFTTVGEGILCCAEKGITVELIIGKMPNISIDSCPGAETESAIRAILENVGPAGFGQAIRAKDWSLPNDPDNNACDCDGSESDQSDVEKDLRGFDIDCIPKAVVLGADRNRTLKIVTWGFLKLAKPPSVQALINCSYKKFHYLTRNNKHIKKLNGLDDVVQGRICRNSFFGSWLQEAVGRIERDNLESVSLCDAKGTHLAVGIAEIMQKAYYPRAIVSHLTLSANRAGHAGGPRRH